MAAPGFFTRSLYRTSVPMGVANECLDEYDNGGPAQPGTYEMRSGCCARRRPVQRLQCVRKWMHETQTAMLFNYSRAVLTDSTLPPCERGVWLYAVDIVFPCECRLCMKEECFLIQWIKGEISAFAGRLWMPGDPAVLFSKVSNETRISKTAKPLRGLFLSHADYMSKQFSDQHVQILLQNTPDVILADLPGHTWHKMWFSFEHARDAMRDVAAAPWGKHMFMDSWIAEAKHILNNIVYRPPELDDKDDKKDVMGKVKAYRDHLKVMAEVNKELKQAKKPRLGVPTLEEFLSGLPCTPVQSGDDDASVTATPTGGSPPGAPAPVAPQRSSQPALPAGPASGASRIISLGAALGPHPGPEIKDPAMQKTETLPLLTANDGSGYTIGTTDGQAGPGEGEHATLADGMRTAEDGLWAHELTARKRYLPKFEILRAACPEKTDDEVKSLITKAKAGSLSTQDAELIRVRVTKLREKYVTAMEKAAGKCPKSLTTAMVGEILGKKTETWTWVSSDKPPAAQGAKSHLYRFTELKPEDREGIRRKKGAHRKAGWYKVTRNYEHVREWMADHGELVDSVAEFLPRKFTPEERKRFVKEIADLYLDQRLKNFEVFQKEEFAKKNLDEVKGRFIISSAQMTIAMGVVAACVEDCIIRCLGTYTSKKMSRDHTVRQHVAYAQGLLGTGDLQTEMCGATDDFGSMDASEYGHIDWEVRHLLGPVAEIFAERLDARLAHGPQACDQKSQRNARVKARKVPGFVVIEFLRQRFSGDRFTSVGNLLFNICVFLLTYSGSYAVKSFMSLVAANNVRLTMLRNGADLYKNRHSCEFGDGLIEKFHFSGSAFPTLYIPQAKGDGSNEVKYSPKWEGDDTHLFFRTSKANIERLVGDVKLKAAAIGVDIDPTRVDLGENFTFTNFLGMEIGLRISKHGRSLRLDSICFPDIERAAASLSAVKRLQPEDPAIRSIVKGNLAAYGVFFDSLTDVSNSLRDAADQISGETRVNAEIMFKLTGERQSKDKVPEFANYLFEVEGQKLLNDELKLDSLALANVKLSGGVTVCAAVETLNKALGDVLESIPRPDATATVVAAVDQAAEGIVGLTAKLRSSLRADAAPFIPGTE